MDKPKPKPPTINELLNKSQPHEEFDKPGDGSLDSQIPYKP